MNNLHRIDDLIDQLSRTTIFLKINLRSSYHQEHTREEDMSKATFRTHDGHYE